MKNIVKIICCSLAVFLMLIRAEALEPKPFDKQINVGDVLYFEVEDEEFDFSKIKFATNTDGQIISGNQYLKKIITRDACVSGTGTCDKYFTAYCLNGNKKYPEYSYLNTTLSSTLLFKSMVAYQIFNECAASNKCTLFDEVDGYRTVSVNGLDTIDLAMLSDFEQGYNSYTVKITGLVLTLKDPSKGNNGVLTVTAEDLRNNLDIDKYDDVNGTYQVTFFKTDFLKNKYSVKPLLNEEKYNKALWIIEHSYPTLSMEEALSKAGITVNSLRETVESLESTTLNALLDSDERQNKLNELMQNYVYATTQYSIWRTMGEYYEVVGNNKLYLGDSITNNETLNKLYQYYIMDREEYIDYSNNEILRSFTVDYPSNELFATTSTEYIYGPYKIKGDMLYTNTIQVNIKTPKSGVSVVDRAGNIINKINDNGEIYLKVDKKANITSVELDLLAENAYVYRDNRGRLFTSVSELDQIVATGATIVKENVAQSLKLDLNPKTGVEDFTLMFIAIIVAFTLGYAVLSFKREPIKQL